MKKLLLGMIILIMVGCSPTPIVVKSEPLTPTPSLVAVELPQVVKLHVGESKNFGQLVLALTEVKNDSRCPVNVACIQAGSVTANLDLSLGNETEHGELATDKNLIWKNIEFRITQVSPLTQAGKTIKKSDYLLTIEVSDANKIETKVEANLTWEEAKQKLANCEVNMVMQLHNLDVSLQLKSGGSRYTKEPQIDEVMKEVDLVRGKCGEIAVATE